MEGFKIPRKLYQEIETVAGIFEMSGDDFLTNLINMAASMNPAVWPSLTHIALKNNVAEGLALQNIIILYLAQHTAWEEMNPGQDYPIPEFIRYKKGIMTGQELLDKTVDFLTGQNQWGKRYLEEFSLTKKDDLVKYPPKEG